MNATELVALILGTAAVVGAINLIWTKAVIPAYRSFMKNRQRVIQVDQVPEIHSKVSEVSDALGRLEPLILSMHHELHPNSGESMNDRLAHTTKAVDRIENALSVHLNDPDAHT